MKKLILVVIAILLVSTSAQAVFTPPSSANLMMWVKADGSVTKDASNNVSSWNDMTANGNNATPPMQQPLWVASGINGQPVIRFSNATATNSNLLQTAKGLINNLTECTIFTVSQKRTLAYSSVVGASADNGGYGGAGRWILLDSYSPTGTQNRAHLQFDSGYAYTHFNGTLDTAAHMQNIIFEGGDTGGVNNTFSNQFDNDLLSVNTTNVYALMSTSEFDIGGTDHMVEVQGPAAYASCDVDIAEVLVYNSVLSASDYAAVTAYLADKYALAVVPEPATMVLLGLGAMLLRRRKA